MPLTPYGLREWLTITVICGALAALGWWLVAWWVAVLMVVVWVAVVSFFRDPIRRVPRDLPAGAMLSPADGTISAIAELEEHYATGGQPAVVIRVLLTVLNVHVNRAPYAGTVTEIRYKPGSFISALKEESAAVNEFNLVRMGVDCGGPEGETIGIRQIAGKVARRIVCALKEGDALERGEKWGMIKFGSTTELILPRPSDVELKVKKGDFVRGGKTVLAVLNAPGASEGSAS